MVSYKGKSRGPTITLIRRFHALPPTINGWEVLMRGAMSGRFMNPRLLLHLAVSLAVFHPTLNYFRAPRGKHSTKGMMQSTMIDLEAFVLESIVEFLRFCNRRSMSNEFEFLLIFDLHRWEGDLNLYV